MRPVIIFVLLNMLLFGFTSCKTSRHSRSDQQFIQENHPVKQLYMSSIAAFNQGNLDLFLENFDSDIKMYGTDGMYSGIDELRDRFGKVFKQFPDVRMEILEFKLESLSESIVLVHFKWKVYPMGRGPAYSGLGSGIYRLKDAKWTEILEAERVTKMDKELISFE